MQPLRNPEIDSAAQDFTLSCTLRPTNCTISISAPGRRVLPAQEGRFKMRRSTTVANSGQLKLLNLAKRVKDLLQITKLYTLCDVHEDEAAAVRSFA